MGDIVLNLPLGAAIKNGVAGCDSETVHARHHEVPIEPLAKTRGASEPRHRGALGKCTCRTISICLYRGLTWLVASVRSFGLSLSQTTVSALIE